MPVTPVTLGLENQMKRSYLYTSESVSEGHPDKLADQISDAILDEFLKLDPNSRVACETILANQFVLVTGEFKTERSTDFKSVESRAESIVRDLLRKVGYSSIDDGIDPENCQVQISFNHQSPNINQGVDQEDGVIGAGDQGLMFGYACDETPELMPLAISLSHRLVKRLSDIRHSNPESFLRPDAKSQVTVRYVDNKPVSVEKVVLSTQHSPEVGLEKLKDYVESQVVDYVIPSELKADNFVVLINPTGKFVVGGPNGDTGLTGRKIIVDTYGGSCPHGGGAFSGKDASKVDRSAAYMARYIAKNIVSAGLASRCQIQIAYAIGMTEPVSFFVDTFNTGKIPDWAIEDSVKKNFNLSPKGIIEELSLQRPIFNKTSVYGHFGREDSDFYWERTDKTSLIKSGVYSGASKSFFLQDLQCCLDSVVARDEFQVVVDPSIKSTFIDRIIKSPLKPEVEIHRNLLDSIEITPVAKVLDQLKSNPSLIWVTLGSSISGVVFRSEEISKAIDGRIVGIAATSVFNGGYAGVSFIKWNHALGEANLSKDAKLTHYINGISLLP